MNERIAGFRRRLRASLQETSLLLAVSAKKPRTRTPQLFLLYKNRSPPPWKPAWSKFWRNVFDVSDKTLYDEKYQATRPRDSVGAPTRLFLLPLRAFLIDPFGKNPSRSISKSRNRSSPRKDRVFFFLVRSIFMMVDRFCPSRKLRRGLCVLG